MGNGNNLSLLVGKAFTRSSGPQPHRNSTATTKENMSESCGSNDFPNAEGKERKPNKGKAKVKEDLEEAFSTTQHFTTYQQPFKKRNKPKRNHQDIAGSSKIMNQELIIHVPSTPITISLKRIIKAGVWFTKQYSAIELSYFFKNPDGHLMVERLNKKYSIEVTCKEVIDKLNYLSTKFSTYCRFISQGVTGLLFDYDTGKIVINSDKLIPDAAVKVQTYEVFYEDVIKHFDSLKFIFSKSWEKYLASKLKKEARCGSRSTERMSSSGKRMSISGPSEFIKNSKPRTSLTTIMNEAKELPFKTMSNRIIRLDMTEIIPIIDTIETFYRTHNEDLFYSCMMLNDKAFKKKCFL